MEYIYSISLCNYIQIFDFKKKSLSPKPICVDFFNYTQIDLDFIGDVYLFVNVLL